jgi:DNA processing protein
MQAPALVLFGELLPPRLADLGHPPKALYLHGELPRGPAVAIVGTRNASPEGLAFTRRLASELATAGIAILSGGAEGIDTAAHQGALDVGGTTVVVAPGGFGRPFPAENAELFRQVVERGGAYLSLVEEQAPASPAMFFPRNGCLVALGHALIVVEAPFRSGARNAAAWARRLGRPLFVVPHSPWHPQGKGCTCELKQGARPLDTPRDVLRLLDAQGLHALPNVALRSAREISEEEGASRQLPLALEGAGLSDPVLLAVQQGASHADEIAERTGLSVAAVQRRLLTLALSGVLVPGPTGSLKLVT